MCILLITNKEDFTSDIVVKKLKERKIQFYRFNTEELSKSVFLNFDISSNSFILYDAKLKKNFDLLSFNAVYYRRPKLPTYNKTKLSKTEKKFLQAECYKSLEGIYKILESKYWISNPYNIREAENKMWQLILAKQLGFKIPQSIISNISSKVDLFVHENNSDCVVKPLSTFKIKDKGEEYSIYTHKINSTLQSKEIEICPSLLQENIHRIFDLRIIVIGNEAYAFSILSHERKDYIDWRQNAEDMLFEEIDIPKDLSSKCVQLTRKMGLHFGAIDMLLSDSGTHYFLEINPNGDWAWLEIKTGCNLCNKIIDKLLEGNEENN